MRFNNRFCALMDIPDLPAGAFEHIGDKKIKPQGGGNPFSGVTDAFSSVLGTDGSGGGILGGLADIDPGPAIGQGLAEVDDFVGREIPGGWATVGLAAATAGAAAYAAPAAGAAAGAAGAGGTAGGISVGGAFVPTVGSAASFTVPAAAAAGTAAGAAGIASEAGQNAFFQSLAQGATGSEAISAGLAAETSIASSLAGPTYAELGYTGLQQGLAGPTYGELGITGLELGTEASTGAPIFDFSSEVMLSPDGNYIPANTLPSEIAGIDAEIKAAGKEAMAKYGGTSSTRRALQSAQMARGLLGGQQPVPQQQPQQIQQSRTNPYGGVDYSGLYNLLAPRMATRNPNSLLG